MYSTSDSGKTGSSTVTNCYPECTTRHSDVKKINNFLVRGPSLQRVQPLPIPYYHWGWGHPLFTTHSLGVFSASILAPSALELCPPNRNPGYAHVHAWYLSGVRG